MNTRFWEWTITGIEGDLAEKKPRAVELELNFEPASHTPPQINSHIVHRSDADDATDVRTDRLARPRRRAFTGKTHRTTIQSLKSIR